MSNDEKAELLKLASRVLFHSDNIIKNVLAVLDSTDKTEQTIHLRLILEAIGQFEFALERLAKLAQSKIDRLVN